ncbi:hypothetical protein CRENBAI_014110 [Crenichthys baileyi]|uniref:Uncharacterized protein n=1 Tax=Crenichthys baileyi TaxID=28760 RepID=A0AAV9RJM6_9TELE
MDRRRHALPNPLAAWSATGALEKPPQRAVTNQRQDKTAERPERCSPKPGMQTITCLKAETLLIDDQG